MSEAPERIWAFYAPHIAEFENGATIVAHETVQHGGAPYVSEKSHRAEVDAAVKRAIEACAEGVNEFALAFDRIKEHPDADPKRCDAAKVALSAIGQKIRTIASDPEAIAKIVRGE